MSDFVVLSSASHSLTVDRAPILVDRFGDRGKSVNVTAGITGTRFVIESTATPPGSFLPLLFTLLTQAQAETLADILDEGGVLTLRLYSGASTSSVAYSGDHQFTALIGDHPDADRSGSVLPTSLTYYSAEVSLYTL